MKNTISSIIIGTVLIIVIVISLTILTMENSMLNTKNKILQTELDYYHDRYLSKTGGTSLCGGGKWINYDIRSFDGGKIWYAVDYGSNKEMIILGEVEKVYPGLMKCIGAWDKISNLKPMELTPTERENLRSLLKDAGVTISTKDSLKLK